MISIRSEYNVNLIIEKVDTLSIEEKFNLAYKEFNVYIEHYPKECIIKIEKNKNYSPELINKYLNQGIYPFYSMMFSENLIPNKKIKIVKEIYHYIQINDIVFFDSIKDLIEIYKFNNQKILDKINVTQELFALKNINLNVISDEIISYEDVMLEKRIVDQNRFIKLSSYINSF